MLTSLNTSEYVGLLVRQLEAVCNDGHVPPAAELTPIVAAALERYERCVAGQERKYYADGGVGRFDHLNTDHYATYLCLLARAAILDFGHDRLAARVYALNKALHALDVFYEVDLPEIFALQHPVGTVLGRARYADYLFVYQRCSVGASVDGDYPAFGEGVVMFGGSSVIGRARIGSNVWVSTGTLIMDGSVPDNSVVFGTAPGNVYRPTTRDVRRDLFRVSAR